MKRAFTLPEAIICVGIVAVIAAIMIPGLFKVRPDDEKLMLKKAYNTTSEVISYLANDVSVFSRMQAEGFADDQIYTDLDGNTYQGNKKFCKIFLSKLNKLKDDDDITVRGSGVFKCSTEFETIDGITWNVATHPDWVADLGKDINDRKDYSKYITVTVTPPKPANASSRTIYVSRYGRMSITDDTFADIVADVKLNKR